MAPNKKKKKPVSNPARGFATTSTASKSKTQDGEKPETASAPPESRGADGQVALGPFDFTMQKDLEKALHELSPEELEKQLEESELQAFIDTYRESAKKSSLRQLSRLQTERRLLRTQADHLKTRLWLPSELMQLIIDRTNALEDGSDDSRGEFPSYQTASNPSEDDLLAKTWALYQLLPQIGFSDPQRESALLGLLRRKQSGKLRIEVIDQDSIWGLEYCLDWLARSFQFEDTLGYESKRGQPLNQRLEAHMRDGDTPPCTSEDSRPASPSSQPTTESQAAVSDVDTANSSPQVASEHESDLESDMEPDEMVRKYISLQTRRFHLSPHDSQQQDKRLRKGNRQPTIGQASGKTALLDARLAKIRSDILFDQDEAEMQWATIKIELAREAAERKRLDIAKDFEAGHKGSDSRKEDPRQLDPQSAASEDEDGGVMLGELFSSLPNTITDADGGPGHLSITDSAGTSIKVMDFGKWNGMSPRRVLEEACRARYVATP